jgi:hypothetical protein
MNKMIPACLPTQYRTLVTNPATIPSFPELKV